MDREFSMKPGDPATNTLIAEMVTRLSDAEEAGFRELLAHAWDECCAAFAWAIREEPNRAPVSWLGYVHDNNPYRAAPVPRESKG